MKRVCKLFCSKCGIKLEIEDTYCFKCGEKVYEYPISEEISLIETRSSRLGKQNKSQKGMIYAMFWQRTGATIIDLTLWVAFSFSIILLLPIDEELLTITGFVISWMYYALLDSSSWQGTIGKKMMGILVCNSEGKRISFLRATFRYFFHIFSALILYIGFLMVIFTNKNHPMSVTSEKLLVLLNRFNRS